MDYIMPILGFITGGGISAVITTRFANRNAKLDYTKRLGDFWEDQNKKLISQVNDLESRVGNLEKLSCVKSDCPSRQTSVA